MKRRGSFTFGVLLILLGAWFLVVRFVPDLGTWVEQFAGWPVWVLGPGLVFILAGLISGVTELMIPGSIISGIGLILYYQDTTGNWESWSYMWALIIVAVGVGVFLSHLFRGKVRKAFEEGGPPIMTGLVLFLIFGSIFRAAFGQNPLLGDYWPLLLVFLGLWMLIRPMFRRGKKKPQVTVNVDFGNDGEVIENAVVEGEVMVEEPEAPKEDWEEELDAAFEDDEEAPAEDESDEA